MNMKKLLYIAIFLSSSFLSSVFAQVTPDTVLNVTDANLIVSQNEDGLTIDVETKDGNLKTFDYPYIAGKTYSVERTYSNPATFFRRQNFSIGFSGFSVGFVKALSAPEGMMQEMGKSMEFSLDQIISFQWNLPGHKDMLAVGIGVDWKNYRMTGDKRLIRKNRQVSLEDWGEGETPVDSRLKTFSLQLPFSYVHSFRSFMKFGLSVILDANIYGSLKGHFKSLDGTKHETFQKCTREINKFSVDFKGTIQFCPYLALYCKYSPFKVFREGLGPQFTPITAGFTFFY